MSKNCSKNGEDGGGVLKRYIFFERPLSAKMLQSMCSILHNLLVLRGVEYSLSWKQTWIIAGSSGTRFQGPLFFLLRPLPKTKAKLAKIGIFAKINAQNQGQIGKNFAQNQV